MYVIEDFKNLGLYEEKAAATECDLDDGKVIEHPKVPQRILNLLSTPGGASHGGDFSRQDSAVITSLLSAGYKPNDIYATFMSSARGRFAIERKAGHVEDYVTRTIERAAGFISHSSTNGHNHGDKINVDFSKKKEGGEGEGLIVSMGNEIEVEKIHWVWPGYIPAGKLTILAGDPGMGKSTIGVDLISRISRGTLMPSGARGVTGTSLIASAEDAPADTIIPRLICSDANISRTGIIREVRHKSDIGEDESRFLSLPRDLTLLRDILKRKGCRVLIIDPLNAFLERGVDTYKDQDMRSVLHPIEAIAEETGTAILVIAHLTKKEDTSTLYRVGGSIGFIGAARSVLSVTQTKEGTRVLYSLKSNLSQRPASLAYETKQVRKLKKTPDQWLGEDVINSSSIRWLGEVGFDPFSKTADSPTGKVAEETTEFLRQVLQDAGEMTVDDIYKEAKNAGVSRTNLTHARTSLGVKVSKKSGTWIWTWPE